MTGDLFLIVVMCVAIVLALVSAALFFTGSIGGGMVFCLGAWLLVMWGKHTVER